MMRTAQPSPGDGRLRPQPERLLGSYHPTADGHADAYLPIFTAA